MQAHGALIEIGEIQNLMDGRFGVYFGGKEFVNVNGARRFEPAVSSSLVLLEHTKILHSKLAERNCHPAVLIVVIVNLRRLSHLPADRNQLEQAVLEDEISRVMVLAEMKVEPERGRVNHVALEIIVDGSRAKARLGNVAQTGDKLIDMDKLNGRFNAHNSAPLTVKAHYTSVRRTSLSLF